MIKKIIFVLMAIVVAAMPVCAEKKGKAKIQFKEYSYDFGVISLSPFIKFPFVAFTSSCIFNIISPTIRYFTTKKQ